MKYILAMLVGCFVACGVSCVDDERSRQVLTHQGFTEIKLNGYSFTACAKDDQFHTKFSAKNFYGARIRGVVCCGFVKGCTVRF